MSQHLGPATRLLLLADRAYREDYSSCLPFIFLSYFWLGAARFASVNAIAAFASAQNVRYARPRQLPPCVLGRASGAPRHRGSTRVPLAPFRPWCLVSNLGFSEFPSGAVLASGMQACCGNQATVWCKRMPPCMVLMSSTNSRFAGVCEGLVENCRCGRNAHG